MLGNLGSWHSYECYFYKYHPPKNTTADQVPPLMATALPSSRCTQGVDLTSKFPRSHHIRQLVLMSWPIGVQSGDQISNEGEVYISSAVCLYWIISVHEYIDWYDAYGWFSITTSHDVSIQPLHLLKANCHYLNACLSLYFSGCRERCGVIKIRQPGVQRHWRERETVFQNGPAGLRRLTRKRYIDLGNEQTHSDKL